MNDDQKDIAKTALIVILAVFAVVMVVYMAIDGVSKPPPPVKFNIDVRLECQVSSYGTITCESLDKVKAPIQNAVVV